MNTRLPTRLWVGTRAIANLLVSRRGTPPVDPQRILIAHHLLLGDTLMLTPLLAKLRERYPNAHIVMTVAKPIVPLYYHCPYGVEAVPYDPRDFDSVRALARNPGFDLALIPGDNRHSWLARALGARWVVAFGGDRPSYKSWPVDSLVAYPPQPGTWGDITADLIGGPAPRAFDPRQWPAPPCLPLGLPDSKYCVLHVGASSSLKLWSSDCWRSLAAHLAHNGYTVVWSAGRGEEALISAVDPEQRHLSYAGKLDLPQLWKLIANAALLVSPDTGVAHLGRLVYTPTVTLFGPGSAVLCGAGKFWESAPYRAVTVDPFPCRDQRLLFRREIAWVRRCGRGLAECSTARCMQAVTVDMVVSAVEELWRPQGERSVVPRL